MKTRKLTTRRVWLPRLVLLSFYHNCLLKYGGTHIEIPSSYYCYVVGRLDLDYKLLLVWETQLLLTVVQGLVIQYQAVQNAFVKQVYSF